MLPLYKRFSKPLTEEEAVAYIKNAEPNQFVPVRFHFPPHQTSQAAKTRLLGCVLDGCAFFILRQNDHFYFRVTHHYKGITLPACVKLHRSQFHQFLSKTNYGKEGEMYVAMKHLARNPLDENAQDWVAACAKRRLEQQL